MPPTVSVALLPSLLPAGWPTSNCIAVVTDTLRFTSTACVALAAGARGITVVSDIELAKQAAAQLPAGSKLCGERACVRIAGFDLGNSPAEYTTESIQGRELIFSTTNGTLAVEAALPAREMVLGCLLNRGRLCDWLHHTAIQSAAAHQPTVASEPAEVWCVCAGTDGKVALEDVLTAGAIVQRLLELSPHWQPGNDASHLALESWRGVGMGTHASESLVERLHLSAGGRNLVAAGFADDLDAVARLDSVDCIPRQVAPRRFESHTSALERG